MSGGLLVLTAHPDDEVLIAGGTLAACAEAGLPTAVVCLTRGEGGPIADPTVAVSAHLGTVRARELQAACDQLGVASVECHEFEDGNLMWSDAAEIVRRLDRTLRSRRPDVVISFGADGLYHHPDHVAAYRYARRALARLEEPPPLYRAVWPSSLMTELTRELAARRLPNDLWGLEPEDFGSARPRQSVALDVRPYLDRKLRALRAHRSQLGAGHAFSAIPGDLAERYLGIERFAQVGARARGNGWLATRLARG